MCGAGLRPGLRGQRGAALVVGLVFLSMLSLMGVAAYMVATQEERMSGNTRDRIRAFEAAEASLRDCEAWLAAGGTNGPKFNDVDGSFAAPKLKKVAPANPDDPPTYVYEDWEDVEFRQEDPDWRSADGEKVVVRESKLDGVALPPRCIIQRAGTSEERCVQCEKEQSGPLPIDEFDVYRISARGYGVSQKTRVDLQVIHRRPRSG